MRLKAGDDFATQAFGDPWDMSNVEDVSLNHADFFGFQPGFGIDGGAWRGAATGLAGLMLYSPGLDPPAIPITREGRLVPISTPVYRKLVCSEFSENPQLVRSVRLQSLPRNRLT